MNEEVRARIEQLSEELWHEIQRSISNGEELAIVKAPPGSGKTFLLLRCVDHAFRNGMRIAVGAQTNSQVDDICRRMARDYPGIHVYRFSSGSRTPENLGPNVEWATRLDDLRQAPGVAVGTIAKWSLVNFRPSDEFDYLFVDEAWQMAWSDFMLCGQVAPRFVLIGDPGQIPPVVTVATDRWETSPRAPHLPAPKLILEDTGLQFRSFGLPACRRLPVDSVDLVRPFYDFPFEAWAFPGERFVRPNRASDFHGADPALDQLEAGSVVALTLPTPDQGPPLACDEEVARRAADVVRRLLERGAEIADGKDAPRAIEPGDIGLAATHRVVNTAMHQSLPDELRNRVRVDTPERWQGLQRPVMLVVHPLSGVVNPSGFDLETGRLCVMASRHQSALIVISRDHVPETLETHIPSADQSIGRSDRVGRGHYQHTEFWRRIAEAGRVFPLDGQPTRAAIANPGTDHSPGSERGSPLGPANSTDSETTTDGADAGRTPEDSSSPPEPSEQATPLSDDTVTSDEFANPPVDSSNSNPQSDPSPEEPPEAPFTPSPAQQKVIEHRGSDLQVIACAGSGKTESISRRVAALISEGAEPASIVAFTFTERAAAELKERIVRRVEGVKGSEFLDRLGPLFVGTIHGYCFRVLQDHVPRYGNYDVLDEHRHAGLLSREYRNLELSKLGAKHWAPIRDFKRIVDVIANELIRPEELEGTPIGECYQAYLEMLDRYHFLSFGLIISKTVEALEDPEILARVRAPLRHLLVDEYQDINPAQGRLIELLSAPPVELCVVGDDDQAIYQWRGSDVRNIVEFQNRRPAAQTVSLDHNRRSRPDIISRANTFARSIPGRLEKAMEPVREAGQNEIVAWSAETEEAEAERIVGAIEELHQQGYRYRDMAVLFRSVRTSAPPFIEAFQQNKIPFSCAGRTGLFLQPEISLFGELFSWVIDGTWSSQRYGGWRDVDFEHILSGLETSFAGGRPVPGLRQYLEDWKAFRRRGTRPVSLVGDFYRILYRLGAHEIDVDTPEGSARFGAFARFSQVLADFEHVNRRGRYVQREGRRTFRAGNDRGIGYFRALANYLQHYARDAYEDFEGEESVDVDAVDIVTIHQAKGLEWPIVFLPALVKNRFPTSQSGRPQSWLLPDKVFPTEKRRRYEGSDAEERRLFYTALTRARDAAYLSFFKRRTNRFRPSPYLVELAGEEIPGRDPLPMPEPPEPERVTTPPSLSASFSDIALFQDCGYRYRLASVWGFQQELAVELGYGRAIHHVLRRIAETSRDSGVIPDADQLRDLVDSELYLPFSDTPAFERMKRAASRLVKHYVDHHEDDLRRVWAVERPFELHLPDGTVAGRADVILDREDGMPDRLAIVDYKVAQDPEREERYRQQLAVYASAGRGEGLDVAAAYLHDLRDSTRDGVDIGLAAMEKAKQAMSSALEHIRHARLEADPESDKCGACDFVRVCRHRDREVVAD